jgi:hypothetical protein
VVKNVRGIEADLEAFRFADTKILARTHVQSPVAEGFEIAEAERANLSGLGIFQQHFAWCPVGISASQTHDATDVCRLQIRAHPVAGDLRGSVHWASGILVNPSPKATRVAAIEVGVGLQFELRSRTRVPIVGGAQSQINGLMLKIKLVHQ